MRKYLYLLILLAVSACPGGPAPINSKDFLSTLEGPKVQSMEETMLESARSMEKQGNFKGAAQIYEQLLEKKSDDKNLMMLLGESERRLGNYEKAINVYDTVLHQDPNHIGAKEGKALALIGKGDFETPSSLLEDVLKADPKRWKSLNALGILFSTRSLQPEAQQYFNAALNQSPNNPSVMNNLGLSQALDKNFTEAFATLAHAAALVPANSEDRKRIDLNLSLVYAANGKIDEAHAIAEKYFSGAALNNNMGLYAHLAQDDQLAKSYLNMALTDSKTFYERAWENLQSINEDSNTARPAIEDVPKTESAPPPVSHDTVKNLAAPEPAGSGR